MDLEELPDLTPPPRRRLLAICGGGYAGLFTAEFILRLEAQLGAQVRDRFDLIAGTSIGGILALGLAKGLTGSQLSTMMQELGPALFGRAGLGLCQPRHDPGPLAERLKKELGEATLKDLPVQVVIPAVAITAGETILFRNAPDDPTRSTKLVDVALATSAAPVFFPPHLIGQRAFVDGGLAANSPEAIAVTEAIHRRAWRADRTSMLVVGATQTCARVPGYLIGAGWGMGEWSKDKKILTTTMRAQMSLARQISTAILGPPKPACGGCGARRKRRKGRRPRQGDAESHSLVEDHG